MVIQNEHPPSFGTAKKPAPLPQVRRLIGPKQLPDKGIFYHPNHLRRMWRRGEFPAPLYTSKRRFAWPEEVIDEWITAKIAEQAVRSTTTKIRELRSENDGQRKARIAARDAALATAATAGNRPNKSGDRNV